MLHRDGGLAPEGRPRLAVVSPGEAHREPEQGASRALPTRLTSFVGRECQSAEVSALLWGCCLLTLTGFGGIGKTRLALEVAADLQGAYPDGVHLVELASLADPVLVPRAVAGALGLDEVPGRSILQVMQERLSRQRLLLVIDNCEHLLDACAELADRLLRTCPGVQILATSQQALGIDGETVWQVPPLDLPAARLPLAETARSGAVRLFVERARARQPDFALDDASLPAVVEICRRLDGIPLAIELAAAWLPMLTVDELAARLGDRFELLTGGSRTALSRHRTLRALVDWSYSRLSNDERRLMARLSVFAGGWTLDAAEDVGFQVSGFGERPDPYRERQRADLLASDPLAECTLSVGERARGTDRPAPETDNPKPDTLRVLAGLVAKSLVVTAPHGGTTRYHFLEMIRQYASEQLTADEATETRRRHAAYFVRLAERAEPRLRGEEQQAWLERLDADHDNLRSALRWSIDAGEVELALQLCGGLRVYWWMRANLHESARWLEQALAAGGQATAVTRARALNGAGDLARSRGQYAQATAFHTEALALARQVGDQRETAIALHFLASLAEVRGDFVEAERLYVQDLALFEGLGDSVGTARALNTLGIVARGQGDYARAVTLHEQSLAITRASGDLWGVSASLDELARVARAQRQVQRTADLCLESLALFHLLGVKRHIAGGLDLAAWVAAARGQHVRAARLYGAAAALREAVGSAALPNEQRVVSRDLAALRSALGPARYAEAWERGRATLPDDAVAYALAPEPADPAAAEVATLTRREREVVERIARGLSNREIAAALAISLLTVESHVRNILRKLGLERRGQVAAWAVQHDLVTVDGMAPARPSSAGLTAGARLARR